MIQWTEDLSVGVAAIDSDHQSLIDLINAVAHSGPSFAQVFSRLLDYASHHFDREEAYMESLDYPGYDDHARLHNDLIDRMGIIMRDHGKDALAQADDAVAVFLGDWLRAHIMVEDQKYAAFVRER